MEEGQIFVYCGKTRSGKTASAVKATKRVKRVSVWDPKGKWAKDHRCERARTRLELLALIKRHRTGPCRIAYCPQALTDHKKEFDFWALCAYTWGRLGAERGKETHAVAEEVGNVTHAGKAQGGWHLLISQGLEFGITLHITSQRPSESDKTTIGNATALRVFQMPRAKDAKYIVDELGDGVTVKEIRELNKLHYVELNHETGKITRGVLRF